MSAKNGVKHDPSAWFELLSEYRLTTLPYDTVLSGVLREDLSPDHPDVVEAIAAWPAPVHLEHGVDGIDVVLVYQLKAPKKDSLLVHALLLLATLVTTLGSGALMAGADPFATRFLELPGFTLPYPSGFDGVKLWLGASFALPFLGVLLSHEMGHFYAARMHRVRASLPYFLPFPPYFSVIGTLGAFIRLRGPTVRRSSLFDIGISGPLASFILSLPMFALGLTWSQAVTVPADALTPFAIRFGAQTVWLGNGVLTHVLASVFGPGSFGEQLIVLHPVALAGWLGLFVTALNLLPLGQLDGGHILYALFPRRHDRIAQTFLLLLLPLGWLWWGWWAWAALILVLHRGRVSHPSVVLPESVMDGPRRALGWVMILMFLLTFAPVPLTL
ncbi:MAG: site-2 protease family protein [Longimicrobiales bacterium]|nr:site-2 protease family protein [Longimicrobiales bacterium]